jgi:hypothetical protein
VADPEWLKERTEMRTTGSQLADKDGTDLEDGLGELTATGIKRRSNPNIIVLIGDKSRNSDLHDPNDT